MDSGQTLQTLLDGRQVRCDANGRYRDVVSGRWLAAAEVEAGLGGGKGSGEALTLHDRMGDALLKAALNQGHAEESVEEAIGKVVQVQAEIALDKDEPAKATAAARLLNKVTGFFENADPEGAGDEPWFVLGRELAIEVLALVEEEQERRAQDGEG